MTFKEKDGKNDFASQLNKDGAYRLKLGISKESFLKMFGSIPVRPKAGRVIDMDFDFSKRDTIMPHPVYGWMFWICVIDPSGATFDKIKSLITDGYNLALKKYVKKKYTQPNLKSKFSGRSPGRGNRE